MFNKQFCFALLVGLSTGLFAQHHDRIWLFGINHADTQPYFGGASMNFNFQPPRIEPRKIGFDFGSYCAIGNDSSGRLMFYTNGISIRDTSGAIMMNGDSINFDQLWISDHDLGYPNGACAFVLPAPGLPHHYYLFHMATRYNPQYSEYVNDPLYFTLIDMKGNKGKGRVLLKNQVAVQGNLSYPVAVKHGNGRDWWVLTGEQNTDKHYRILLSPAGVQGPFTQQYGPEPFYEEITGINSIAPDGQTFVRVDQNNNLRIFSFDRCTGLLGNLRVVPFAPGFEVFQSEFSADSRRLYLSTTTAVMSVDVQAPEIAATLDTLAVYDGALAPFPTAFWTAARMPDGKIYWATFNSTLRLHVAHQPDLPGQCADVEQDGVVLPVYNGGTMCRFPAYELGRLEQSPCDTLPLLPSDPEFLTTPYPGPAFSGPDTGYRVLKPLGNTWGATESTLPPASYLQEIQRKAGRETAQPKFSKAIRQNEH